MKIRLHATYSNGAYGQNWGVRSVRQLEETPEGTVVHFYGLAGTCRRKRGQCSLADFALWARYEVALNENSWHRIQSDDSDAE